MPTEHQAIMWLVYCGLGASLIFAFIVAQRSSNPSGGASEAYVGAAMGSFASMVLGIVIGFVVRFYDVPGNPGIGNAFSYGGIGLIIGALVGVVGGVIGARVGKFFNPYLR